jgi:eukaryotic-like serine/threonine-protein kinase
MSEQSTPSRDDLTRDLLGQWNLDDAPGPGAESGRIEDDSLLAPIRPVAPRPRILPDSANDTPPPAPPAPPPAIPPSFPMDPSDPFLDFRLDPGAEALSQNLQSLLGPRRPRVVVPSPAPAGRSAATFAPGKAIEPVRTLASLKPGDLLGGFRLVGELGRGAFARVFLAEQIDLAGRRVALKVSKAEGNEPLLLARLQHTHIVPIHSVHDDAATGLRLLCMPYLGGANLAQVLETAGGRTAPAAHRRSLVEALDEVSLRLQAQTGLSSESRPAPWPRSRSRRSAGRGPSAAASGEPSGGRLSGSGALAAGTPALACPHAAAWSQARGSLARISSLWARLVWRASAGDAVPGSLEDRDFDQPARLFLRNANRIQAAVWIIARLAEGLEHAHSRGLLHRDLKPSNVLIAGDGTPMLLDFNLSTLAGQCDPEEGEKAMLGGTLPYMAPEHLEAFHPEIAGPVDAVDERSDIYALGLILFEMLAGEHPFPEPPPGMPLLEVIRRQVQLRRRVPSLRAANPEVPWSLDAIARKCLEPVPARRYARAREFSEDLGRFLDDLPLKHTPEPSLRERLAKWTRRHPRFCNTASVSAMAGVVLLMLGAIVFLLTETVQNQNARLKLQVFRSQFEECQFLLNIGSGPVEHVERGLELARRTVDRLGLSRSGDLCGDSWVRRLVKSEEDDVRRQAGELMMLQARAHVSLAGRSRSEGVRREVAEWAIHWLDRAERLDPKPPSALFSDRARYHAALGQAAQAAHDRAIAAKLPPVSAHDFALLGTARLAAGDPFGAESALLLALDRDPKDFWAHFALGHSRLEQGRFLDAASEFNACVVLEPRFAWPYLNLGLALARVGRLDEARRSYQHALGANPRFSEAWVDLALVELERNDLEAAGKALDEAVALGRTEPGVLAASAEVKARRGDRAAAARLFDRLIRQHPDDPGLLTARGLSLVAADPDSARLDLTRALKLNPRHARAHYALAVLLRTSSPREALTHADAALAAEPDLLDAVQLRAVVRARLGDLAAASDAERLCQVPTPYHLYNAACALALLAETTHDSRLAPRALQCLDRALDAGFPASRATSDPDLHVLHDLSDYRRVIDRPRFPGRPAP